MSPLAWAFAGSTGFAVVLGLGGRHAGPAWEVAALLVTLGYPLLLLVGAAHTVGRWKAGGASVAGPLLVLLTAVPAVGAIRLADGALHDRRFARSLPELEALLARAPLGIGERMRIPADSLPRDIRHCCGGLVIARRDSTGQLSATVLGQRGIAYLYDPGGRRLARGIRAQRWRSHRALAPDWYRLVRF